MLHCNKNGVTLPPRSRFASDGAIDAAQGKDKAFGRGWQQP
jgi:hypothetical protein